MTDRDRVFGVDRLELDALRRRCDKIKEEQCSMAEALNRVGRHMSKRKRATARQISTSIAMRLPDVRNTLARMVELGIVERDGELWEDSVVSGQRMAAAYKWIGEDE